MVGLELDVLYVKTNGEGTTTVANVVDVDQTLETTELHIPVLLKLQLPLGLAKPFLGFGITYVSQLDSTYTVDDSGITNTVDTSGNPTESYTMLSASLGLAIDLPSVKIPIEVRGNYRAASDKQEDRVSFDNSFSKANVNPTWEGQVWLMVGLQYSGGI